MINQKYIVITNRLKRGFNEHSYNFHLFLKQHIFHLQGLSKITNQILNHSSVTTVS
jgi:hypothetical protein